MAPGHSGRFFAQLSLLLRQKVPMRDALELIASDFPAREWSSAIRRLGERMAQGETLSSALLELPDPFPRELKRIVEQMESEGMEARDVEALSAWPDAGTAGLQASLARMFAHASILVRAGLPWAGIFEALRRPGDPEILLEALEGLAHPAEAPRDLSESMARFPRVFSPALRRIVRQMEWNGTADVTFRELGIALSRGWFLPEGEGGTSLPREAL